MYSRETTTPAFFIRGAKPQRQAPTMGLRMTEPPHRSEKNEAQVEVRAFDIASNLLAPSP
jgi:hypothetical protein